MGSSAGDDPEPYRSVLAYFFKRKLKYMFAILVQRAAYFVSGESSMLMPKDEKAVKFALQTAQYEYRGDAVSEICGGRAKAL